MISLQWKQAAGPGHALGQTAGHCTVSWKWPRGTEAGVGQDAINKTEAAMEISTGKHTGFGNKHTPLPLSWSNASSLQKLNVLPGERNHLCWSQKDGGD
uniref:Uncharacterized protein n=1 Tax=Knipowitschia caucasica TaxID=637954 RepID=A0AAV2JRC0_KNICA